MKPSLEVWIENGPLIFVPVRLCRHRVWRGDKLFPGVRIPSCGALTEFEREVIEYGINEGTRVKPGCVYKDIIASSLEDGLNQDELLDLGDTVTRHIVYEFRA